MKLAVLYQATPAHPMVLREKHIDRLREAIPDLEITHCATEDELLEKCPDADALFCWGRDTPERWVRGADSVKWLQALSTGIDGFESLRKIKPELRISKIAGISGIPMSESAIMYILMFLCITGVFSSIIGTGVRFVYTIILNAVLNIAELFI